MHKLEYPEDAKRIQTVLLDVFNVDASLAECECLWHLHCEERHRRRYLCLPPGPELKKELEDILNTGIGVPRAFDMMFFRSVGG